MEAQLKEKHDVSATFTVTVPATVVDAAFERVLATLARQVRVPGFRPGRAPRGVLVQRIGAEALAEEVRESLVDEHYPKAVRELELMPVHAHFHADAPVEGADYTFEVHADLYPTFELPDLDAIDLDATVPEPSDDDVARTVERLREEHATLVPVERPVEALDVLTLETLGEGGGMMPVDLSRTEGNLVEQLTGRSMGDELTLDLGPDPSDGASQASDGDPDDAQPGDAQASDDRAGDDGAGDDGVTADPPTAEASDGEAGSDTATADTSGAGDPAPESAAGSSAEPPRRSLAVRVVDVKAKELPETDDTFAATLGFDSWEATLAEIRKSLAAQADREAFAQQREAFVEQLMAATEIPLPRSLVTRRQRSLLDELAEDLQRQRRMTLQDYLAELDARDARAGFEEELRQAAERAVKRDLVLEALLERVGTSISDDEFDTAVRMMASRERKDVNRFKREMGEEWLQNYRFLLNRDRAVREVVAAKTGRDQGPNQREEPGPNT